MSTVHTLHPGPLGELLLTGARSPAGFTLTSLSLTAGENPSGERDDRPFAEAHRQLDAYFAGRLPRFELPLTTTGTPFQRAVWRALEDIPYGTTITYGELTARLGLPRARAQAVGRALGANPHLLVRPCHRVIGADGSMRGYAGGTDAKVRLLTHEGALQPALI
ncbi:methylated-DNA--[protein]-cysteine S-methyltransferase [Streptomyces sp. NPDC014983]|uniref:methylated-DNA--[protein]-cysteine S-methyltransferase n=1 Tax=Streptomyces sp. NPDC014983 TaxID=3364933 RepID=UPI003702BBB8